MPYSCEALEEHEGQTDGHTVPNTLLEELLELRLLAHAVGTALFYLSANLAHLVLDVCMVRVKVAELRQDLLSPFKVITTRQPT